MFKTDYKKKCEELQVELARNAKLIEEISTCNDKVHLIKMIVDNPDEFFLDGDYVVDARPAIYGGRPVTFSEAVMFKAGKEAAQKENDIVLSSNDATMKELQGIVDKLSRELSDEKNFSATQTHLNEKMMLEYKDTVRALTENFEAEIKNLNEVNSTLVDQIAQLKLDLQEAQTKLIRIERGETIDTPFPIITDYGTVTEV